MRLLMTIIIVVVFIIIVFIMGMMMISTPIGGKDTGRDRATLFEKNPTTRFEASP